MANAQASGLTGEVPERALLSAALHSRESYEHLNQYLSPADFSTHVGFWWKAAGDYYRRDRLARCVDLGTLCRDGFSDRPPGDKQRIMLANILSDLPSAPSPPNLANAALRYMRSRAGMQLAASIGSGDIAAQADALDVYSRLMAATSLRRRRARGGNGEKYTRARPIDALFEKIDPSKKIPLYPSKLNTRTGGGILPGQHVLIFGRPESGKSSLAIYMAVKLAIEGKQRVLFAGNEDQIDIIKARGVSCVTGLTSDEIAQDHERAAALYTELGGEERLHFVQLHNAAATDLRDIVDDVSPSVVVLDQIRNLDSTSDNDVRALEENGQAFRALLVEHEMIGISVSQARVDRKWLLLRDLYGSSTVLQGTADLMLGIGFDEELQAQCRRAISVVKNKLYSGPESKSGFIVDVDFSRSTFT